MRPYLQLLLQQIFPLTGYEKHGNSYSIPHPNYSAAVQPYSEEKWGAGSHVFMEVGKEKVNYNSGMMLEVDDEDTDFGLLGYDLM